MVSLYIPGMCCCSGCCCFVFPGVVWFTLLKILAFHPIYGPRWVPPLCVVFLFSIVLVWMKLFCPRC